MAKRGRPETYRPEFDKQAYKICLLGATDKELGDFFEVSESQIKNWRTRKPGFRSACERGKLSADADVVNSLFRNATGYEWVEERLVTVTRGKRQIQVLKKIKHYRPSETVACIFWLKNRRKKYWRDKWDVTVGGPNGEELPKTIEFVFRDGREMKDVTPRKLSHEG